MRSYHCPYCNSERLILLENTTDYAEYLKKIMEHFSPFNLAILGAKLCKNSPIPPYIGGMVAIVVGGVVVLVSQHYFYKHYSHAQHYQCLNCHKTFYSSDV
ncbi:hypothetical protein [Acinetobacter baylyi]|uniref:hypothetical protein n=1 Tax=Acinetobacter baylyi TaxID=202950 RepID=UPI0009D78F83|nr:hypothetical protein [Acinetobacter baylyi]